MRRPNFKGWVSRELAYLSGENTLNMRRLAFLAQTKGSRLWERLALYAIATGQVERLRGFLYNEEMIADLDSLAGELGNTDFNDPQNIEKLHMPARVQKALLSYKAAYKKIDSRNESKRLRLEKIVALQKKKGIPTARICKALGLDSGNVSAYLKHADIDRLSLENATNVMKYLNAI